MAKRDTPVDLIEAPEGDSGFNRKGHATPTRKQQEAARKKPLVPSDRKEAARSAKTQTQAARERARIGMAAGEEKYLLARDKGPQKRFVRDYVDARFSIGEVIIPVMFGVILLTLVPNQSIQTYLMLVLYAFVLIVVVDIYIMGTKINNRLKSKYGSLDRGLRWYGAMRALQLRPMRLPKPQVKRGNFPA